MGAFIAVKLCLEAEHPVGHEPKRECHTALLLSRAVLAKVRPYPGDRGGLLPWGDAVNTSTFQPVHPLVAGQDLQDRESQILCKEEGGRGIGEEGQMFGERYPLSPHLK